MQKLQSRLPPAMKDLGNLNHHNFVVITIAFDRIEIRILNPFLNRDLTCGLYCLHGLICCCRYLRKKGEASTKKFGNF